MARREWLLVAGFMLHPIPVALLLLCLGFLLALVMPYTAPLAVPVLAAVSLPLGLGLLLQQCQRALGVIGLLLAIREGPPSEQKAFVVAAVVEGGLSVLLLILSGWVFAMVALRLAALWPPSMVFWAVYGLVMGRRMAGVASEAGEKLREARGRVLEAEETSLSA